MTHTTTLPLPSVSPGVLAFAVERGVERYLPDLVAAARRIFPDLPIDILVEDDPELSNNRQIVFEVEMNGRGVEEWASTHRQWIDETFRICPATHVHVF